MTLLHVVGARPNFMKLQPVHSACRARGIAQKIVHTGQHYDDNMSRIFFRELEIPEPDFNLGVGSASHGRQTADVLAKLEDLFEAERPRRVVVYGDVNSTLAGALAASKLGIPVAHVEAGLRSYDRTMPEEINRVLTDQIADLLFTPSEEAGRNLHREGRQEVQIQFVGNVMVDSLLRALPKATLAAPAPAEFVLVTLHRPSNVDDPDRLERLLGTMERIAKKIPVLFPVHPRTRQRMRRDVGVTLMEPQGYFEFLALQKRAKAVVTDSGGIQEETTVLGVPCLTIRPNTERPATVEWGTNTLVGEAGERLEREVDAILAGRGKRGTIPPLWDGRAGERIAEALR